MGRIRIGVSGWRYTPWRGNFYPKKLVQARELEYASRVFSSIELNGSFYSLQRPSSYAQWAQQTPPGFVFVDLAFIALLRKHRIAWVVADTPRPWPLFEDVTSDFIYVRLHGATELYNSRYTDEQLDRWADCIRAWAAGKQPADARLISEDPPPARGSRDVYCYFDNTDKLHAPNNAAQLMFKLGLRDSPVIVDHWNPGKTGPSL